MSSEGVLMFFMPEFVQKLFFTVRSFKWSFNWDFCTHQHFSGLPWITEMLLRTTNISFDRVPEVLHTVESTLMSQLCQKVILIFFFMFFEVDKTNWAHRDSAVRNLEIYIQKDQMWITLEKTRILLKVVRYNGIRGQMWFFFLFCFVGCISRGRNWLKIPIQFRADRRGKIKQWL